MTRAVDPELVPGVVIGLDWDEEGGWCAAVGPGGRVLGDWVEVTSTAAGADDVLALAQRHREATGALPPVLVEATRRPLLYELRARGLQVEMVSANIVSPPRKGKGRRRAKSDKADARRIGQHYGIDRHAFHPLPSPTPLGVRITLLARQERQARLLAQQAAARARSLLAEYYPAPLRCWNVADLCDDEVAARVLLEAPTPDLGRALSFERLVEIVRATGKASWVEKEAERAYNALQYPFLTYPSEQVVSAYAESLTAALTTLLPAVQQHLQLESRLKVAVKEHPFWDLLQPAVGTGPKIVGRLIAEMGDDVGRFASANQLAAFAGTIPIPNESNTRGRPVRRDVKGNGLHQAFWDWSEVARQYSPGAMQLYWTKRRAGDHHSTAIRKVAARLTRRAFHCVANGVVWDEDKVWPNAPTLAEARAFRDEVKPTLTQRVRKHTPRALPEVAEGAA